MKERIVILVMDRGLVKIGYLSLCPNLAFHWNLRRCRVIRRWGTTGGLAQLQTGPTETTKLDTLHNSIVPYRAVLDIIEVEQEAWKSHLS
jgi:hypothetical protein